LTGIIFRAKPRPVMETSDPPRDVLPEEPSQGSPEKPPASPHDTLVYKILSDPALAAAHLKVGMAKEIADEIDWATLEQDTNRFVTGNLDNHFTDLFFKATLRKHPIRIRLLLEHSSHPKPFALLQALQYQLRHWERESLQRRTSDGKTQRLTPILTILLHHSESGWRGNTRFIHYFGLDAELERLLRPHVVDFGIFLDDISKVQTESLIQRPVPPEVQLMLFALRHGRSGRKILDELPQMAPVLTLLLQDPNGRLVLALIFVYIRRVAKLSETDMRNALQDLIESHLDPEMVAVWTQFEEGKREGKREGLRSTLRRLLTQRFGSLSAAHLASLESASLDDLDAMTLRVLTAPTADDVFNIPK
jgi:Putative transposase, YhgA-like